MKWLLGLVVVLLVGAVVEASGVLGPSEEGVFHPDHTRVFNGFQETSSELVGGDGVSSVEPNSECKQTGETAWRCNRRWAPVEHPELAELLEADVNVYDDRVVVGPIQRTPDAV